MGSSIPVYWLGWEQPEYLVLLGMLPLLVWLSRRTLAALGPVRGLLALGARSTVIVLLTLALAGMQHVASTDNQAAVFLLDTSASLNAKRQQRGFEFIQSAARGMRADKDRAGLVCFNGVPLIEQVPRPTLAAERFTAGPRNNATNIAAAIRLATAILPPDAARRIVLISDGNENIDDVLLEAERMRAPGVPLDVAPIRYRHTREVVVERVLAPAASPRDETINLSVLLRSTHATNGTLQLFHNDALLPDPWSTGAGGSSLTLEEGANRFTTPIRLNAPGLHRFRAVFQPAAPEDDGLSKNNTAEAFTIVGGPQRALILRNPARQSEPEDLSLLVGPLQSAGISCDVREVGDVALDAPTLMPYACVILDNISAITLPAPQQASLSSYVRDLGGGLIALGGDQAFCMGGYAHTPLEEVLPVETDRSKLTILSLGMVIVLDRSGSMAGEKLDLAKAAAIGAIRLMSAHDSIGVVAFDSTPEWVLSLAPALNKNQLISKVFQIGIGGGTDMYPGLQLSFDKLHSCSANLRHVILLTDGQSAPGDFDGLARKMREAGITLSAIAVGDDADQELLGRLATTTDGRLYVTDSAQPLPQIFARETVLASLSGMYERTFTPKANALLSASIMAGLDPSDLPPLHGYVITAAKPLAQVPIVRETPDGTDPILAHWQVGLGRTVAFTSGMWSRWGQDWARWPGFSKLWSQAVRWASRSTRSGDFDVQFGVLDGRAVVALEAGSELYSHCANLRMIVRLVDPALKATTLPLRQCGPGRYEASFPLDEEGDYVVQGAYSAGAGENAVSGVALGGLSHTRSAEWRDLHSNDGLLHELARRTGGRVLNLEHPEAVFEASSVKPVRTRLPLWEALVQLALAMFVVDVAIRRIAISPRLAASALRQQIAELSGRNTPASVAALATLRRARDRVRESHVLKPEANDRVPIRRIGEPDAPLRDADPPAAAPPSVRSSDASDSMQSEAESPPFAERLKHVKRRARKEQDER